MIAFISKCSEICDYSS